MKKECCHIGLNNDVENAERNSVHYLQHYNIFITIRMNASGIASFRR